MKKIEEHLAFYARFHRNAKNRATHFVGIPIIIFSILIPMSWVSLSNGLSLATVFVLAVLIYYFVLDVALALAMTCFVAVALFLAQKTVALGLATSAIVFVGAFVGGWILQLIGHYFEGKKPALMENFFQTLIGPLFMMAEVFYALGLKRDLQARVEKTNVD